MATMIYKHEDNDDIHCMLAFVVLVLAQSTFIVVVLPFSDYRRPPSF